MEVIKYIFSDEGFGYVLIAYGIWMAYKILTHRKNK